MPRSREPSRLRLSISVIRPGALDVDWGAVPGHLDWGFAPWFDLADDPPVAYREEGGDRERIGSLVSRRLMLLVLALLHGWRRRRARTMA